MDESEAERKMEAGDEILRALGDVPVAYGLTCELPAAHGEPLTELDRIWYDHFTREDRTWMFILNGDEVTHEIEALNLLLDPGSAFVICENKLLAHITPLGISWYRDADSGERLGDEDAPIRYWDDQLLEVLHARLTEKGKELPPIEEIVSDND